MALEITLKKYVILFLIILFAGLLIALYIVKTQYVFPQYRSLQNQIDMNKAYIIEEEIKSDEDYLLKLAQDNGAWDNTYEYMKGNYTNYINITWPKQSYFSLDINYIGFYDIDGNLVHEELYDLKTQKMLQLNFTPMQKKNILITQTEIDNNISEKSGYTTTPKGAMIYGSYIITNNNEDLASVGTMVFGRIVDNTLIEELETHTGVNVKYINTTIGNSSLYKEELDHGLYDYYVNYYDNQKSSVFSLKIESDREIISVFSLYSRDNIVILGLFIIFILFMYFVLEIAFVSPIKNLSHHMQKMQESKEYKEIDTKNKKMIFEINQLYYSFNKLLTGNSKTKNKK